MAYPTLPVSANYGEDYVDGRMLDNSGDGFARVRKLHADRRRWQLVHPMLTRAQWDTLMAHYEANQTLPFTLTSRIDGVTYNVVYTARPRATLHLGGLRTAVVQLAQSS